MPRVKVWARVLMREMGSNRNPHATRKEMTIPLPGMTPLRTHHAPKATMRMMPDSAMKETMGQTRDWPRMTVMCFSPTLRDALSKVSRAWGSTV